MPSFTGYGMRLLVFGFVVTYSISLFSVVFLIMKTDRMETVLKFKQSLANRVIIVF
jgi:hypothetical protein